MAGKINPKFPLSVVGNVVLVRHTGDKHFNGWCGLPEKYRTRPATITQADYDNGNVEISWKKDDGEIHRHWEYGCNIYASGLLCTLVQAGVGVIKAVCKEGYDPVSVIENLRTTDDMAEFNEKFSLLSAHKISSLKTIVLVTVDTQ